MMARKRLLILTLLMTIAIFGPAASLFSAEPPASGVNAEKIIGPTMWAVCVLDCTNPIDARANIRIKKIEGCDVDTQAVSKSSLTIPITACPPPEGELVHVRFNASAIFGLPCQAIVTKVKNYKLDGDLVSFDAQIQFVVDEDYSGEICQ